MSKSRTALQKVLAEFGLSQSEVALYLASLSTGATSIRQLALTAKLNRTTTYSVLESLMQKGLMRTEMRGLRKYYCPESPEQLRNLYQERIVRLEQSLPTLASMFHFQQSESVIRHYQGIESIKRIYNETLIDVKARDYYFVISNFELWVRLDEDFMNRFIGRRAKIYTDIRLLLRDSETVAEHRRHELDWNLRIKILPETMTVTTIMVIIPRSVIIHDLLPPYHAVVIENSSVAEMMRQLFENFWSLTPDTLSRAPTNKRPAKIEREIKEKR